MATTSYDLYIGGAWVGAESDEALDVINPATEEAIGQVPQASIADVDRAVAAARLAFEEGPWARMTPRERSDALLRFTQVVADRKAELVDLIIAEAGPARWVADALQFDTGFRYAQWMAERTASFPVQEPLPVQAGARGLGQGVIVKEPIGVVAAITPFNFPLYLNLSKVVPALAMGNSVVLKPSPFTPLEAFVLGEIADEAGLPPGVLNVVTGDVEAGEHLTTHPGGRHDLVHRVGHRGQEDHGPGRRGPEEGPPGAGGQVPQHRLRRQRRGQVRGVGRGRASPSTPVRAARCPPGSWPTAASTTRWSSAWRRRWPR